MTLFQSRASHRISMHTYSSEALGLFLRPVVAEEKGHGCAIVKEAPEARVASENEVEKS